MDEFPWWPVCVGCGRRTVDPAAPARYDVLAAVGDELPRGPFDAECFASTATGRAEAEG
jgi:hypothetical protein